MSGQRPGSFCPNTGDICPKAGSAYVDGWKEGASTSADFNAGWTEGQRALWRWLDALPRYDIPAEDGGCIVVLDLRQLEAAFPDAPAASRNAPPQEAPDA